MRLVMVSYRLPFTVSFSDDCPRFQESAGGLTTGLRRYLNRNTNQAKEPRELVWVGWPGASVLVRQQAEVKHCSFCRFKATPVFLSDESPEGFCDKTVWPLFHYFPNLARFEQDSWEEYQCANRTFAEAVLGVLRPGDVCWVYDHQLMLLPRLIRERCPDLPISFFLHIPFPSVELFRLLPFAWRTEIIEGLLGASLIGFHTHDYARRFLDCVLRTCGHEHRLGQLKLGDRVVKVDTFPMGIDFEKYAETAKAPETEERVAEFRQKCPGLKVLFSVDRLDYTKGLINRLRGYELFLRKCPAWRGKVVFVLSVAPSRTSLEGTQAMKLEIEHTVGSIVGEYGTVYWTPVIYQYRNLSFDEIVVLYRLCDVALITPLCEGMNLVAKEFLASRPDQSGVLILSETAGAAKELGEAIIISPHHHGEIASAIEQALALPTGEVVKRNQILQDRLRRYDVTRWVAEFVQTLLTTQEVEATCRARLLTGKVHRTLVQNYRSAAQRALLLDYDGTLVPFASQPQLAHPDAELVELLCALGTEPGNAVVIVSGRSRGDLEQWFGQLPLALVAEHGLWVRALGADWRPLRDFSTTWKNQVRPILQLHVDRLPGASLEEKDHSLAWHYRRADPEQALIRAKELLDDLADFKQNIDFQVLEGNKVIEICNTGISKGTAAKEWLSSQPTEFVLAIGDSWTDTDMFQALPLSAYSVRIGFNRRAVGYHLGSDTAVRHLLRELKQASSRRTT